MNPEYLVESLAHGDLRTTGAADEVVPIIASDARLFDAVFSAITSSDHGLAMRASDAAEKASRVNPAVLVPYKARLLEVAQSSKQQEVQWHTAQMIEKLSLDQPDRLEFFSALERMYSTARSLIVKASALQAIVSVGAGDPALETRANQVVEAALGSSAPSIRARARKLARPR